MNYQQGQLVHCCQLAGMYWQLKIQWREGFEELRSQLHQDQPYNRTVCLVHCHSEFVRGTLTVVLGSEVLRKMKLESTLTYSEN